MAGNELESIQNDNINMKRNVRSPVWAHFQIVGSMAHCKYCEKEYKIQDSLKYHLDKKHSSVVGVLFTAKPSEVAIDHAKDCLMRWVVETDQPFTTIEHPRFKALLNSLCTKNSSLVDSLSQSAKVLRSNLMTIYERESQLVVDTCKAVEGQMSFTLDGWTSSNRIPFVAVTGHWIDANFVMRNKLMGFKHFPLRHTGKNICDLFVSLIQKYNSKVLVITMDNASNNETFSNELEHISKDIGIRYSSQTRIRCFAHVLNLAVQELLKSLKSQPNFDTIEECRENTVDVWTGTDCHIGNAVAKIRNVVTKIRLSGIREENLSQLNVSFGIKDLKLVLDVKTRWNSTYAMLSQATYLRQSLQAIMQTDKDIRKFTYQTPNGIHYPYSLICLSLLLEDLFDPRFARRPIWYELLDFNEATNSFSSVAYPTISMVMPTYHWLLEKLNNPTMDPLLEEACLIARAKLNTYRESSNIEAFWIAIALDPTLKMDFIQANCEKTQAKSTKTKILNIFNTYYEKSSVASTSNAACTVEDRTGILAFFPKRPAKFVRGSELLKFFQDDLQPPKTNILQWWKDNQIMYPSVCEMAKDYLAIPATSVPAERVFSAGSDLITTKRGSLQADTVTAMMYLKLWWKDNDSTN